MQHGLDRALSRGRSPRERRPASPASSMILSRSGGGSRKNPDTTALRSRGRGAAPRGSLRPRDAELQEQRSSGRIRPAKRCSPARTACSSRTHGIAGGAPAQMPSRRRLRPVPRQRGRRSRASSGPPPLDLVTLTGDEGDAWTVTGTASRTGPSPRRASCRPAAPMRWRRRRADLDSLPTSSAQAGAPLGEGAGRAGRAERTAGRPWWSRSQSQLAR